MRIIRTLLVTTIWAAASAAIWAQGRNIGFEWPATSADAQRTSWQRNDPNISAGAMAKGFVLQWNEKLDTAPRQGVALAQGITMNAANVFTPTSFVTGASNTVYAIDNDTGFPFWQQRFNAPLPAPTAMCPGGITGAAGRTVNVMPPAAAPPPAPEPPRTGYRGGVGLPGEGVPMDLAVARRGGGGAVGNRAGGPPAPPAPPAAPAAPARGGAPAAAPAPPAGGGGGGLLAGRYNGAIYVVSSDGVLHALGQSSGIEVEQPSPFLPANARYSDLTGVGDVLYTSTSNGCGGAPNAVWAITLDAAKKTATSWRTNGGSPVGNIAFTSAGTPIVAIGPGQAAAGGYANAVVALDPKTLQPKDWFTDASAEVVATPVVFRHNAREIVAAATRDGRILLLDAASLGGANHSTPLAAPRLPGAAAAPDALATWEDGAGTRWLLASSGKAIAALKIADEGGRLSLQAGWTSRDLGAPTAPIVVNDVVFAAASGRPQGAGVLYAFDGRTGKELWNSAKTITASIPQNNLWASNSQVHVGTADGTVYAFGFTLERR
jgi:outer membrane protein assembly factor BamB